MIRSKCQVCRVLPYENVVSLVFFGHFVECVWSDTYSKALTRSLNNDNRVSFLAAEACLLAGSARNAYHTKYRGFFVGNDLSCATLRKGVFAAAAALTLLSLLASILYYWAHSRADTGGWQKHQNEGVGLTTQRHHPGEFEKA